MVLVVDGTGAVTHRILQGPNPDQELADEDATKLSTDPTAVTWLLGDNQGSIKDVVYGNGTEVDHISYDSFGNIIGQSGPSAAPRFGYTGMQTDAESGLLYDNARYYDTFTAFLHGQTPGIGEVGVAQIVLAAGCAGLAQVGRPPPLLWPHGLHRPHRFHAGNVAVGRVDRNYENICGIARGNPSLIHLADDGQ
jgi:RHS repeat-associated protein